jgi:hypothetical protein
MAAARTSATGMIAGFLSVSGSRRVCASSGSAGADLGEMRVTSRI